MNKLKTALAWRGGNNLSFLTYGAWRKGELGANSQQIATALVRGSPAYRVSSYVATDEDWPCEIGVFEVEGTTWPEEPETTFRGWLQQLCSAGAKMSWMMFEGAFNDVRDTFSPHMSSQIYAVRITCETDAVEFALEDESRLSVAWQQATGRARARLLEAFPDILAISGG